MSIAQAVPVEGKWIPSTCGMCLHGCGIKVYVQGGVALKIEGDETNPDNLGKLCPKGNAGLSRLYDPNRVRKPLKRTNPQKGPGVDPKWVEISWDEAYEITARELGKVRRDDPRKLLCAIGDFQRILLWGWPAAFGSPNFYPADLETEELSIKYPELIGKFQIIFFCEVLEHLKLAPNEILRDFKRLLAPGGTIYLTTPNGMSAGVFLAYFEAKSPVVQYSRSNRAAHLDNFVHVREHTMRELVSEFENAGLRIRHRAIKEYFDPNSLWATAFIGARSLLTYIAESA